MPTLNLSEEQVLELVEQLPVEKRESLFKSLAASSWPRWAELSRYGEGRAREVAEQRGLDWDAMSEPAREEFLDELVHEDRQCRS